MEMQLSNSAVPVKLRTAAADAALHYANALIELQRQRMVAEETGVMDELLVAQEYLFHTARPLLAAACKAVAENSLYGPVAG